jgi:aminopeptidase N
MTDKLAALSCLASIDCSERNDAIETFYRDAGSNALVLNKWFMIQAIADNDNVLARVKELRSHPAFILSNPNRARSLISAFAGNLHHFHRIDGSGYRFLADSILDIDRLNPQVAARMVSSFAQWRAFDATRGEMMRTELRRIEEEKGLSPDTFEVVLRCLK